MLTASLPPARARIVPVIVVPGITASVLTDWYPASPREIWSPTRLVLGDYEPMSLHPSLPPTNADPHYRYEAAQPTLVRASRAFGIIYEDLVEALRHDLATDDVPVTPVFAFAYDWRQDNFLTIRRLAAFIDEVIERTRLMPHDPAYVEGPTCDEVDLVGHSMGGNLIAACIASGLVGIGNACKVRRVVTLGTPFRGAPAALAKLATGLGSLTGRAARERERSAARVTPSVYQLLPTYPGGLVREITGPVQACVCARHDASGAPAIQPDDSDTPLDGARWEDLPLEAALASQPSILQSLAVLLRRQVPAAGSLDDPAEAARHAERLLRV